MIWVLTHQPFADVMNFDGIAPELVNGRLAMLGFLAAVGAEISSGGVETSYCGPHQTGATHVCALRHVGQQ